MSRLLLRDISGLSILDLVDARLLADVPINGIECYSVSAQHPRSGSEWVFSIEKHSLLMRKLKTGFGSESGWFSEEVHENIRVNQPIDASKFKV